MYDEAYVKISIVRRRQINYKSPLVSSFILSSRTEINYMHSDKTYKKFFILYWDIQSKFYQMYPLNNNILLISPNFIRHFRDFRDYGRRDSRVYKTKQIHNWVEQDKLFYLFFQNQSAGQCLSILLNVSKYQAYFIYFFPYSVGLLKTFIGYCVLHSIIAPFSNLNLNNNIVSSKLYLFKVFQIQNIAHYIYDLNISLPFQNLFILLSYQIYIRLVFQIFYHLRLIINIQNFKEMQGNVHDIITRIKAKLNHFTEEDTPPIINLCKKYKFIPDQATHSFHQQKQKTGNYQNQTRYGKQKQTHAITRVDKKYGNSMGEQKNEAILKNSRSCKMIQIHKNKDPIIIHTQTYLSLRKRNQVLEDDVQKLKNRLKLLQQSLEKGRSCRNMEKINENGIKEKQLLKKNNVNERIKRSERTQTNNMSEKNVKKLHKNYKVTFDKNSNNLECNPEGKKGKKIDQKKNQTSLHNITFNDKLKFELSQSPTKQTYFKTLQRFKSSITLEATNPSSQQGIKQEKQNTKKEKNNISVGQSNASNASYLSPIQRYGHKNGNIFPKRANENTKLHKGSRKKLQ